MSFAEVHDPHPREVIGGNSPPRAAVLSVQYETLLAETDSISNRVASLPVKIENDIALGRVGDVVKDARSLEKRIDETRSKEAGPHIAAQREINAFFKLFTENLAGIAKNLGDRATAYNNAKAAEARRVLAEEARRARDEEDRQREIAEAAAAKNRAGAVLRHEDRAEEAAERAERLESAARSSAADLTRVRSSSGTVATTRTSWNFEILDPLKIPLDALRPYLARADLEKAIRSYVKMGNRDLAGVRIFEDNKATFR